MSQIYRGNQDNSARLKHWKYIKRVRKNGKWRYYYDHDQLKDDMGFDERDAVKKQELHVMGLDAMQRVQRQKYNEVSPKMGPATSMQKRQMDDYKANINELESAKRVAQARLNTRMDEYAKTPLGKMENAINKGLNFIKDLFS